MSDTPVCPECGGRLRADAPRGLCARCLMNAALAGTGANTVPADSATQAQRTDTGVPDDPAETIIRSEVEQDGPARSASGRSTTPAAAGRVAALSADEFQRVVVELGIIDAQTVDRHRSAGGPASGEIELVRSLIQAQVLTAYQACAIQQGKARGLVVSRYLILDKLGAGAMGVVFKARHRLLDRVVALKILPPSFARREERVLRFRREMQAAGRLNHPNVVAVLDADEDRGIYFLAMEYIDGRDLDHLIRDHGAFPVEQALECAIQAARGLEAAHARGIVHRDIKPANLMLDASGTLRVLDLGLARLLSDQDSSPPGQSVPHHLTRTGVFMGTVDFMAPEQAEDSHNVDHRADIYSLGCSLYFLLTGRPPFEGATVITRLVAHQEQPPPSIRATRPDLPESLDAAYLAMMAKRPGDRPQTMANVIALLNSCRPAAGRRLSLQSFSSTVLEIPSSARTEPNPPVFIARDDSGGFQFETEPNFEDAGLADRSLDLARPGSAATLLERLEAGVLPSRARHRPAVLAAVAAAVAFAAFICFVVIPRGGESQSPVGAVPLKSTPPGDVASTPKPVELVDTAGSRPETKPTSSEGAAEGAAIPAPKETPEPRPAAAALDVPARARGAPPDVPRPKVAKLPSYDVAARFTQHNGPLTAIAVTRDGEVALSAGMDHTARLWGVASGKEFLKLNHPSAVLDAAMTPDRQLALTVTKGKPGTNGTLRLWDLKKGKTVFTGGSEFHVGAIPAVAFVFNGRALSGGEDGQAILWNLGAHRPIGKLGVQKSVVRSHALAVFPDGRHAVTGGVHGIVHVWNLATRRQSGSWIGHEGPISDISISADGRRAVTCSQDHTVILWDVARESQVRRFAMPGQDRARSVAILPDGNVVAAGGAVGHLVLWDAKTGAILRQAEPPFNLHAALAVLPPDGRRVLTADHDGVVRIWTPRQP